jgi:hypothetical protein
MLVDSILSFLFNLSPIRPSGTFPRLREKDFLAHFWSKAHDDILKRLLEAVLLMLLSDKEKHSSFGFNRITSGKPL